MALYCCVVYVTEPSGLFAYKLVDYSESNDDPDLAMVTVLNKIDTNLYMFCNEKKFISTEPLKSIRDIGRSIEL